MKVAMSGHERIAKPVLADYLAVMSRAVFQAGIRWADIDRKWDSLRKAFDGFDPSKVARYGQRDIDRIMATPGILHSERKIRATIANAGVMLALDAEFGGFKKYLRSHGTYDGAVADIKRRFAYVGDISAYYFLFRAGETVPPFKRWIGTVVGEHPRIREMVAARSKGRGRASRTST